MTEKRFHRGFVGKEMVFFWWHVGRGARRMWREMVFDRLFVARHFKLVVFEKKSGQMMIVSRITMASHRTSVVLIQLLLWWPFLVGRQFALGFDSS